MCFVSCRYLCRVFYFVYLCHVSCLVCPERTVPARTDKYMKYNTIQYVRTCRGTHYPTNDLYKTHSYWVPNHPLNFSTVRPEVPEIWKRGVHVRTCGCTPPMICVKHLGNDSRALFTYFTHNICLWCFQFFILHSGLQSYSSVCGARSVGVQVVYLTLSTFHHQAHPVD